MDIRDAVVKLFSARVLLSVIEFVAIAYFTQNLGAAALGSFFLYQSFIGIAAILSNLGLRRAAEKELSAGENTGEVITTTVLLKTALVLPFLLLIGLGHNYIDSYIGIIGVSPYLALGLITTQARRLVFRLLAGQMRVGQTASLRVIGKILWVLVGAGLIYMGMDALAILIGFIVGDLAMLTGGLVRLDLAYAKPTVERAHSLLSYGKYIFLRSSGSYIYSWMDVAVLGFFVPNAAVGAYEIAWRVASVSLQLTNSIRESIFPRISELHAEGKSHEIRQILTQWIQPPLYMTIPGLFGAVVLGYETLGIPFGQEVVIAVPVLVIFMAEKVIRTGHLLYSATIYAMDRPELGYRGEVIALATNLVLNLSLIPVYGIIGAAVATTISSAVAALINGYYLSSLIQLNLPWPQIAWSGVCGILMAGAVYMLKPTLPTGWPGLLIGVSTGVLLYGSLLLASGSIREEMFAIKENLS